MTVDEYINSLGARLLSADQKVLLLAAKAFYVDMVRGKQGNNDQFDSFYWAEGEPDIDLHPGSGKVGVYGKNGVFSVFLPEVGKNGLDRVPVAGLPEKTGSENNFANI